MEAQEEIKDVKETEIERDPGGDVGGEREILGETEVMKLQTKET